MSDINAPCRIHDDCLADHERGGGRAKEYGQPQLVVSNFFVEPSGHYVDAS